LVDATKRTFVAEQFTFDQVLRNDYFRREIRYGSFERSLPLPEGIKAEDLKATYRDGVLELSAPMSKEAAPKEVKVQVG
jgi:HSP20 family protein